MQGLEGDSDAILQVLSEIESLRIKGIYNLIETELGLLERYATECKGEVQVIEGVQALVSLTEEAVALCDDIRNHHGGGGVHIDMDKDKDKVNKHKAAAIFNNKDVMIASAVPLLRKGLVLPKLSLLGTFGEKALRPRVFATHAYNGEIHYDDALCGYYAFLEYLAYTAFQLLIGAVTVDKVKISGLHRDLLQLSSYTLLQRTYLHHSGTVTTTTLRGAGAALSPSTSGAAKVSVIVALQRVADCLLSLCNPYPPPPAEGERGDTQAPSSRTIRASIFVQSLPNFQQQRQQQGEGEGEDEGAASSRSTKRSDTTLVYGQALADQLEESRIEGLRAAQHEDEEDDKMATLMVLPCLVLFSALLEARQKVLYVHRTHSKLDRHDEGEGEGDGGLAAAKQSLFDAITSIRSFTAYNASLSPQQTHGYNADSSSSAASFLSFAGRHAEWALLLKMICLLGERSVGVHDDDGDGLPSPSLSLSEPEGGEGNEERREMVARLCSPALDPVFHSLKSSLRAIDYANQHILPMLSLSSPSPATTTAIAPGGGGASVADDEDEEEQQQQQHQGLMCFDRIARLLEVAPSRLEPYHCEVLLIPPPSLLIGQLLHGEWFHHNTAGLVRRFELMTYAQELLHDLLFPPVALITGERGADSDGADTTTSSGQGSGEKGKKEDIKGYFKTLEKKKKLENTRKQELNLNDEEETSPGVSLLRNVIQTLQVQANE